ncbi:hypothetical protein QBC38DRAFT_367392 [Podospora fimiseda]|uniref:DUF8035 domain-containing protein n=1 Tax=Podospora fimiseda TaxID=252190 RepID=A0AAN7BMP9_9PEZI|nr:hypothetical protein QBC38DRAFT_367392 [Podospora fimiseda]
MTVDDSILVSIESVDDFAEELYCRSDAAGPAFDNLRSAIHHLQNAFNDLHAEARDPESLINNGHNGAYVRRLTSLLEDSDVTLKQANTLLEKYDSNKPNVDAILREKPDQTLKAQEIEVVRAELVSQKLKIYNFLETVEIHNPRFKEEHQALDETTDSDQRRAMIQNKVDAVANRIFQRRRQGSPTSRGDEGEELWQEFKSELVKEGFDHEVLHKNKEVLQAYIRDLESHRALEDGAPPSVRGLLECGTPGTAPIAAAAVVTGHHPMPNRDSRPNDNQVPVSSNEGRRRVPTTTSSAPGSLQLYTHLEPPSISIDSSRLSYEEQFTPSDSPDSSDTESSSSSNSNPISSQTTLISTQELLALDQLEADKMASRNGGKRGPPPNYDISPGTSPNARYRPLPPAGMAQHYNEKAGGVYPGTTNRYSPPPPPPPYSSTLSPTSSTPPPPYPATPTAPSANFNLTVSRICTGSPNSQQPSRQYSQLAPDGRGNGIPLDATWTRIKRTLVSPVVLQRAGVRYEARPDFVAVLGKLTHEQIAEFARQTLEERNSRGGGAGGGGPLLPNNRIRGRTFGDPPAPPSASRSRGTTNRFRSTNHSTYDDDNNSNWGGGRSDWSEDEQTYRRNKYTPSDYHPDNNRYNTPEPDPRRVYPFIVSPPASVNGDIKSSPSSTVDPKPILKNRNPNKVRFDKDGPREIWPGELAGKKPQQQSRHRDERERDRERDRERERDRNRDRPRDRDRERDRMRERGEHHRSHRHRDRDREREREKEWDDKPKRSSLKEMGSAIGLGSAAATLISVLSEAVQYL